MRSLGVTEYRSLITRPGHLPLQTAAHPSPLCAVLALRAAGQGLISLSSFYTVEVLWPGKAPGCCPRYRITYPPSPLPRESSGLSSGLYVRLYLASLGECVQCTAGLLVCPAQGPMVLTLLMISLGTVSLCLFSRAGLAVCRRPDDTQAPYSPIILACGI